MRGRMRGRSKKGGKGGWKSVESSWKRDIKEEAFGLASIFSAFSCEGWVELYLLLSAVQNWNFLFLKKYKLLQPGVWQWKLSKE